MYRQTLACLSKLQLLCVHPALVTSDEEPKRREMIKDVRLSGKLMVLRELLWDAGIGERCGGRKCIHRHFVTDVVAVIIVMSVFQSHVE